MKRIISLSLLVLLLLLSITSCDPCLKGEGAIVADTRPLTLFSSIDADDVTMDIYPGTENKVIITGYQNLVPAFETTVANNTLQLTFSGNKRISNNNIHISLYVTDITAIYQNGSKDLHLFAPVPASNLKIDLNGSGNVTVDSGIFNTLEAKINGSGNMSIGTGTAQNAILTINGSGEINAGSLAAESVNATISGSGNIYTTVLQHLVASVSGSGNIKYHGTPHRVTTTVSGSGTISSY